MSGFDLAVYCAEPERLEASRALAERLGAPLLTGAEGSCWPRFALCYRDGCLKLLDAAAIKLGGLCVEVDPRPGEQHSYPAPKKDLIAQAVGRKTHAIIDATAGWAQDGLALFRMGYQVTLIERSPVMAALIEDGLRRLSEKDWVKQRAIQAPALLAGDAISLLSDLAGQAECVYLDPMFPPKRKKSALAKKSMHVLRDILGDDLDREQLFAAAWAAAGKRVVVKCPDYAAPLGGKPSASFQGKLLRFDVYLK